MDYLIQISSSPALLALNEEMGYLAQVFNVSMRILFFFPLLSMVSPVSAAALQSGAQELTWSEYDRIRELYRRIHRDESLVIDLSNFSIFLRQEEIIQDLIQHKVPGIYDKSFQNWSRSFHSFKVTTFKYKILGGVDFREWLEDQQSYLIKKKFWCSLNSSFCVLEAEAKRRIVYCWTLKQLQLEGARNDGSNRPVTLHRDVCRHIRSFLEGPLLLTSTNTIPDA